MPLQRLYVLSCDVLPCQAMMTHSVRFLLRLGDLLGCGLTLSDDELEECVPELLRGSAENKDKEVRQLLARLRSESLFWFQPV